MMIGESGKRRRGKKWDAETEKRKKGSSPNRQAERTGKYYLSSLHIKGSRTTWDSLEPGFPSEFIPVKTGTGMTK
jgi:hypothetical protein